MTFTADFIKSVDWSHPLFLRALLIVLVQPIIWHVIARMEHHTKIITRLCGGSAQLGVVLMAIEIMGLGMLRNLWVSEAIDAQLQLGALDSLLNSIVAFMLIIVGFQFVFVSGWALGFNGTFLGFVPPDWDYFGILMKARVTGYPYTVFDNPMYVGSTMIFVGSALGKASPAGFVLAGAVAASYALILFFEGPFTAMIYAQAAAKVARPGSKVSTGIKST